MKSKCVQCSNWETGLARFVELKSYKIELQSGTILCLTGMTIQMNSMRVVGSFGIDVAVNCSVALSCPLHRGAFCQSFFRWIYYCHSKGQLISKCTFGFIVWTKLPMKLFLNFCPEIFCTFLGASLKLFGASCRLPYVCYYVPRKPIKLPGSPQKATKKNSGQKSRNNFVGFLEEVFRPKGHFEIN